jgi:cytochrome c oxidase subunit 2
MIAVPARGHVNWNGWLLPVDYARHGVAIDRLFDWILWITIIVFVLVQVTLIGFLIRYRHRERQRKARFIKGSKRLEFFWTLIPTLILAGLALGSAKVWDDYRYSTNDRNAADILVIGQQFKWNIIYPGKDGKFGRYLIYPKPTDLAWPHQPGDTTHFFAGVPGPASLPYKQAVAAIDQFISQNGPEFQLGKDLSDPDGEDDDYQDALGRTLFLPVDRPVHIVVLSRDVIHDFYLPNFRVQLYSVPGMTGSFTFTPTETTAEMEAPSRRQYTLEELAALIPEAEYRTVSGDRIVSSEVLAQLKSQGITTVNAYRPAHLEAICAQLCGIGHSMMKTDIIVLSQEEYHRRFE